MPVKAQEADAVMFGRTFFKLQEEFDKLCERFDPADIRIVVMCNGCNTRTTEAQKRILIYNEFRCMDCFRKMATDPRSGLSIPQNAREEKLDELLVPVKVCRERPNLVTNFIVKLFEPKQEVLLHLPSSPAPCK